MKLIRGLSLTRPWPFAFNNGPAPKRVENRSWKPHAYIIGNYLALHAAQSWDEDDRDLISDLTGLGVPNNSDSPRSEIFAVCRVAGYIESEADARLAPEQGQWFFGPYGWLLDDYVQLIEPVPCKGGQGLWTFEKRQKELAQLRVVYARSMAQYMLSTFP